MTELLDIALIEKNLNTLKKSILDLHGVNSTHRTYIMGLCAGLHRYIDWLREPDAADKSRDTLALNMYCKLYLDADIKDRGPWVKEIRELMKGMRIRIHVCRQREFHWSENGLLVTTQAVLE